MALVVTFLLTLTTGALAAVDSVRCIVWQGDPAKFHTAISGQSVRLKAVITTTDTSQIWYRWVFGDGTTSAVSALSGSTTYKIATDHIYTGAVGTPFTAQLQVDDVDSSMANAVSDPFLIKIEDNILAARINIAIDNGLWYLFTSDYKNANIHTFDNSPAMVWNYSNYFASPTASAVQAFAINNHKINGDTSEDPYVEAVQQGMNWLIQGYYVNTSYPMLNALAINLTTNGDNPEQGQASPNGYGIEVRDYSSRPIYEGGQIIDAIISSGVLPTDDTGRDFTGRGSNWTFGELIQDMVDMYAWGQADAGVDWGGWRYSWNNDADNSACQWAAVGIIPAQEAPWNCTVPDWVKTYNNEKWLTYSHYIWNSGGVEYGGFGYTSPGSGWGTSPSGLVQMNMNNSIGYDNPATPADERDPRWIRTERYFADNWINFLNSSNSYGWYAFAKAMRLAHPQPVQRLVSNNLDWYNGSGGTKGLAERILERQNTTTGHFNGNWTSAQHTTAWMIITLRPALFKASPVACFTANPNPTYPDFAISFDPSCSDHSETGKDIGNLTLFEWDWDHDGVYDESSPGPVVTTHAFACASIPCIYPVDLRVTDDDPEALTATYTLNVEITNPPHPPVANAGGPYMVSLCTGDSLLLDGSGSFDGNEGTHEAGCPGCPDDTITAWNWDLIPPLTEFTDEAGETVSLDVPAITSYFTPGPHNIALRVVDNTELAYPGSGETNLTDADFTTVNVYEGCGPCTITARVKSGKVQLVWTHTGAASYDIYRSTVGPSGPFIKIADDHVTTYATYLDTTVVNGTTYYYRVVTSDGCGSLAEDATPTALRTR